MAFKLYRNAIILSYDLNYAHQNQLGLLDTGLCLTLLLIGTTLKESTYILTFQNLHSVLHLAKTGCCTFSCHAPRVHFPVSLACRRGCLTKLMNEMWEEVMYTIFRSSPQKSPTENVFGHSPFQLGGTETASNINSVSIWSN